MFSFKSVRKPLSLVLAVAMLAYPLAVYVSLEHIQQHWIALVLAVLAAVRAMISRERFWWWVAAGVLALCAFSWLRHDAAMLKLYPVMVNGVMLCTFAISLWRPPSVVERLARLTEPGLSEHGVRYTARVTLIWCVFFVLNGGMALYTALVTSDRVWALYNGLVAYLLMGGLMAAEMLVRQRVRTHIQERLAP